MKITNEERAVFQMFKSSLPTTTISWNTLRLESANLATQNSIAFSINQNDNSIPQSKTEIRLAQTDAFVVTRMGVYIAKISAAAGVVRAMNILRTYASSSIFTVALEVDAMNAIYNWSLQIQVNNSVLYPNLDTLQFQRVPETAQQLLAQTVTAGILAGSSSVYVRDGWPDNDYGFIEAIPTITFYGGKNNVISIAAQPNSDSVNFAPAGIAGANIALIFFRGFQLQNVNSTLINANIGKMLKTPAGRNPRMKEAYNNWKKYK